MTALGRRTWAALNHPEDWAFTEYRAIYKAGVLCLWISSGPWFLDMCLKTSLGLGILGLVERHFLWLKLKHCMNQHYAMMIDKEIANGK